MKNGTWVPYYQVDAFTDTPFSGNPAGVCILDRPISPNQMQLLASEVNLPETAFVGPPDEDGVRPIRWFTPLVEVSVGGHATLSAAHVLRSRGDAAPFRFRGGSEVYTVERAGGVMRIDFPADPPKVALPPSGMLRALGSPQGVPALRGRTAWLIRLPRREHVELLEPDTARLLEVYPGDDVLGVAVTAPDEGDADFVSRFFAPWIGIPEDPVTGVAFASLVPYWTEQLGQPALTARQLSAREGLLTVSVDRDRVYLSGGAVTVAEGSMLLPPEDPVGAPAHRSR